MTLEQEQGLVTKQTLTETEVAEIQRLSDMCNAYEGLHMRLSFDMLRNRPKNETNDFLYYEQGTLVGYLGLDNFGNKEKEVVGMVHPEHRRKGIFTSLLRAAEEECRHRSIQKLVLTCERASASGQAFMKTIHAHLDHSEHEMLLKTFKERPVFDERLLYRRAMSDEDLEAIAQIMATDFGDVEFARQHVKDVLGHSNQRFYLATLGGPDLGCDEPIASIRLDDMERQVGIYGFVVHPEYRGRGYGRQLLQEMIHLVHAEGSKEIMLDVDTDNTNAIGLYLSTGFEIKTTYDYYEVDIA